MGILCIVMFLIGFLTAVLALLEQAYGLKVEREKVNAKLKEIQDLTKGADAK